MYGTLLGTVRGFSPRMLSMVKVSIGVVVLPSSPFAVLFLDCLPACCSERRLPALFATGTCDEGPTFLRPFVDTSGGASGPLAAFDVGELVPGVRWLSAAAVAGPVESGSTLGDWQSAQFDSVPSSAGPSDSLGPAGPGVTLKNGLRLGYFLVWHPSFVEASVRLIL